MRFPIPLLFLYTIFMVPYSNRLRVATRGRPPPPRPQRPGLLQRRRERADMAHALSQRAATLPHRVQRLVCARRRAMAAAVVQLRAVGRDADRGAVVEAQPARGKGEGEGGGGGE